MGMRDFFSLSLFLLLKMAHFKKKLCCVTNRFCVREKEFVKITEEVLWLFFPPNNSASGSDEG